MLDNLGFGEFFMLALLALLFFGPERLPQIGARIGRWIRNLTQYSSSFMAEWRDEALAIQDAVSEVKGIRDEIIAARSEIAGTLDTARGEMSGAISGATQDVRQQIQRSTQLPPPSSGDTESPVEPTVAETQDITHNVLPAPAPELQQPSTPPMGVSRAATSGLGLPSEPVRESTLAQVLTGKSLHESPSEPPAHPAVKSGLSAVHDPSSVGVLCDQVALLEREMHTLRGEIADLRAALLSQAERTDSTEQAPAAEPSSSLPVAVGEST